jgi:tRNA (uracil-5-)-methyltransferase
MSEHIHAGQVRIAPDTEAELPESKRARLEGQDHVLVSGSSIAEQNAKNATKLPKSKTESKKSKRKLKHTKLNLPEPCSPEDVLWQEIKFVLGGDIVEAAVEEGVEFDSPFSFQQEVEVVVKSLSPSGELYQGNHEGTDLQMAHVFTGDAIAVPTNEAQRKTPWIIVVPFSLPGEVVLAKVYRNARMHSVADLVNVVNPNADMRDDSRVQCRYFGKCGGCQYQVRLPTPNLMLMLTLELTDAVIRHSAFAQARCHHQGVQKIFWCATELLIKKFKFADYLARSARNFCPRRPPDYRLTAAVWLPDENHSAF